MKKLIFNGYQAEDLGFIVVENGGEILAQEDYEVVKIEGRNGGLIINKGTYSDIEKEFIITTTDFLEEEDIEGMMDNIKKWFFNVKDNRLYYAFDDKYNIVKKVIFKENVQTSFELFGDFSVTFLCEPFYYKNENVITINKTSTTSDVSYTFFNYGDFESYPNIKVYGSGNVTFRLNDVDITVENVNESVEIDTKLLTCTSGGENKIQDLSSDFPTLQIGENIIEISSGQNISKIEIIPRTIYR